MTFLGHSFSPELLDATCNSAKSFISGKFTQLHNSLTNSISTISCLELYNRNFVFGNVLSPYSNREHHFGLPAHMFLDHRWFAFRQPYLLREHQSRLHRASERRLLDGASRSIRVAASGRYPLISAIGLPVLQNSNSCSLFCACLCPYPRTVLSAGTCRTPEHIESVFFHKT